jgi:hypothetical protein
MSKYVVSQLLKLHVSIVCVIGKFLLYFVYPFLGETRNDTGFWFTGRDLLGDVIHEHVECGDMD